MLFCLAALLTAPASIPVTTSSTGAQVLFADAREKAINFQDAEAAALLRKAIGLDPDFAQAHAWLGRVLGGEEGLRETERAHQLAARLPETERTQIDILLAESKGEDERARMLKRQLADALPEDWFAQFQEGVQASYDHKSQATILYLNRTVQLNPRAAVAYNYLGFVLAQQGQFEDAIANLKKMVALKPDESNSYDSYGEVLLMAGHLEEAEAQFRRAHELAPTDFMSAAGAAYAQFFRGNYASGRETVAAARKTVLRPSDRVALDDVAAWSWAAEGKPEAALKAVDVMEGDGKKNELAFARAPYERAQLLGEMGRLQDARAQLDVARKRLPQLKGVEGVRLRRLVDVAGAEIASLAGDVTGARQALSALQTELRASPSNADLRGQVHYAEGLVALAQKDPRAAEEAFARCPDTLWSCSAALIKAERLAGDTARADDAKDKLLRKYARDMLHRGDDPAYLYLRAKLARE